MGRQVHIKRPEQQLQGAVMRFLATALPAASIAFSVPNEGNRSRGALGAMVGAGLTPGVSDVIIITGGRPFAIELKATTKLTDKQLQFAERWQDAGGLWREARSVEEVETFLRDHGVPLRATVLPIAAGQKGIA